MLVLILIGFVAIIRRQSKKLRALKKQSLPEPSIKLSKDNITTFPKFATGNTIPELDGVDTLLMNPELEAKAIYELPANEAVGSELYSPTGQMKSASVRQRILEYQRNALRQAQSSQRRRFRREDPQAEFGSIAQTIIPHPPQFRHPTWTPDEGGPHPLTRAWSDPAISPKTRRRQHSNPEGFEDWTSDVDAVNEEPNRLKYGSV